MPYRTFPTYKSVFRFYSLSEFCSNEMKVKVVLEKRKKTSPSRKWEKKTKKEPVGSALKT